MLEAPYPSFESDVVHDIFRLMVKHRVLLSNKKHFQATKLLKNMIVLYAKMASSKADKDALVAYFERKVVVTKKMSAEAKKFKGAEKSVEQIRSSVNKDDCWAGDCNDYWKSSVTGVSEKQEVVVKEAPDVGGTKEEKPVVLAQTIDDATLVSGYETVGECTSREQVLLFFAPENKTLTKRKYNAVIKSTMLSFLKSVDTKSWNRVKASKSIFLIADAILTLVQEGKAN